jgi:hypothetical protein
MSDATPSPMGAPRPGSSDVPTYLGATHSADSQGGSTHSFGESTGISQDNGQSSVWGAVAVSKPRTYLPLAIIATFMCCLVPGVIAVVNAARVDILWNAGRHDDAVRASKRARGWLIIAAVCLIGLVCLFVFSDSSTTDVSW